MPNKNSLIIITAFLSVFWLTLSGSFDMQHIITGIVLAAIISFYSNQLFDYNNMTIKLSKVMLILEFVFFLITEITKANIYIAKIVLNPSLPISPTNVKIKTELKSDFLKTLLANSITLTPGTLSIDINNDEILVHTLTYESAEGLKNWPISRILKKLEGI